MPSVTEPLASAGNVMLGEGGRAARVVSIVGPTASGKTGLGIAIARRLAERGERAEIVNADAYQMYRGMDIGTAKPTAEEQAAVPHHLIDIIDPDDTMTVARFQQLARRIIVELQSRGIRRFLSVVRGCMPVPRSMTYRFPVRIRRFASGLSAVNARRVPECCSRSFVPRTRRRRRGWIRVIRVVPSGPLRSSN